MYRRRQLPGSGLQTRMTLSYMWVTALTVILLESLNAVLLSLIGSAGQVSSHTSQLLPALHASYPALILYPWLQAVFMIGQVLLLAPLIGGLFGTLTTRGIVRRVRDLATATTQIAHGHYSQRVRTMRRDEIGQLETQFNRMAEQLAESLAQREVLAEQTARLAERARISRELHDAISQDLFSLRMVTGGLQGALMTGVHPSDLQPYVEMLQETTTRMIREMRALLLELRPLQLEHLGLAAALEELATVYRARLGITITTQIDPVQLDAGMEHALFRCVQEAFTNAARHADATMITLNLQSTPQGIACCVTDNGKGFDLAARATQHGIGLLSIEERVHELHGSLTLDTTPGRGTRIQVMLPLSGTGGNA